MSALPLSETALSPDAEIVRDYLEASMIPDPDAAAA